MLTRVLELPNTSRLLLEASQVHMGSPNALPHLTPLKSEASPRLGGRRTNQYSVMLRGYQLSLQFQLERQQAGGEWHCMRRTHNI